MTAPPLWQHQIRDIDTYLSTDGVFNTSDPGTGKTRTIIEVIRARRTPTLIFAPKSILQCAWGDDIEKYAPELTYAIAYAENRLEAMTSDALIKITNIDAAAWLVKQPAVMRQFKDGFLVIDESTSIKNPSARRTKAVMALRPLFAQCTCMSGTPCPQGVTDLWSQIHVIDNGQRLGTAFYRFKNIVQTPVSKGKFTQWTDKPGAIDAVGDMIADITIRNRREDCLDLPPHMMIYRSYEITAEHTRVYNALKRDALVEVNQGEITAVNAAVLLNKLLQVASGAVYDSEGVAHLVDTGRYDLVLDLAEERAQSVVVFRWKHQRDYLTKEATARSISHGVIDGSVAGHERTKLIEQFQAGKLRILFIQPQSAGHGITLTNGTATIWASPTHNAEEFEQVNARIYRGGQKQMTETIMVSAKGTVDAKVYTALEAKRASMAELLELLR